MRFLFVGFYHLFFVVFHLRNLQIWLNYILVFYIGKQFDLIIVRKKKVWKHCFVCRFVLIRQKPLIIIITLSHKPTNISQIFHTIVTLWMRLWSLVCLFLKDFVFHLFCLKCLPIRRRRRILISSYSLFLPSFASNLLV